MQTNQKGQRVDVTIHSADSFFPVACPVMSFAEAVVCIFDVWFVGLCLVLFLKRTFLKTTVLAW